MEDTTQTQGPDLVYCPGKVQPEGTTVVPAEERAPIYDMVNSEEPSTSQMHTTRHQVKNIKFSPNTNLCSPGLTSAY